MERQRNHDGSDSSQDGPKGRNDDQINLLQSMMEDP